MADGGLDEFGRERSGRRPMPVQRASSIALEKLLARGAKRKAESDMSAKKRAIPTPVTCASSSTTPILPPPVACASSSTSLNPPPPATCASSSTPPNLPPATCASSSALASTLLDSMAATLNTSPLNPRAAEFQPFKLAQKGAAAVEPSSAFCSGSPPSSASAPAAAALPRPVSDTLLNPRAATFQPGQHWPVLQGTAAATPSTTSEGCGEGIVHARAEVLAEASREAGAGVGTQPQKQRRKQPKKFTDKPPGPNEVQEAPTAGSAAAGSASSSGGVGVASTSCGQHAVAHGGQHAVAHGAFGSGGASSSQQSVLSSGGAALLACVASDATASAPAAPGGFEYRGTSTATTLSLFCVCCDISVGKFSTTQAKMPGSQYWSQRSAALLESAKTHAQGKKHRSKRGLNKRLQEAKARLVNAAGGVGGAAHAGGVGGATGAACCIVPAHSNPFHMTANGFEYRSTLQPPAAGAMGATWHQHGLAPCCSGPWNNGGTLWSPATGAAATGVHVEMARTFEHESASPAAMPAAILTVEHLTQSTSVRACVQCKQAFTPSLRRVETNQMVHLCAPCMVKAARK